MKKLMHGVGGQKAWLAVAISLALSACGGGGSGGVKSGSSSSTGSNPSSSSSVTQPPVDAQLALTDTYAAHDQGYTGAGVTIGVVDSGIMRSNPTVAGRVSQELIYVDSTQNNTTIDDVVGHGTWVSEIAAGAAWASFPGGIAPSANLVSARIISDNAPSDNGSTPPSQVSTTDAQFFAQVNQDLISAGVNVMNNSWGGITWSSTDTTVTQAFHDAYADFVLNHNGLVVFAAGNDSQANPSTIAALPSLSQAADLEQGWLVAVAVNSNDPTQLDGYSNKCGIAMDYCLAAPGDVIVLDKNTTSTTTNPSYYIVEGTSFAAPQVSGAAALVWQAYPYFSNDLVRQTLLGTADPLGGSQPNPTFGYGELDVGKAVNGPEQFNWGDVTVNFSGVSSWNNPISGSGGLIKQGTGTLNLTQPSSYTGLTQVQGGTLTAVSLAGSVDIAAQGTLGDTHNIGGNVNNSGALVVGGGNVTINGNYVQQGATGRLAVSLGSALEVNGNATLSGGDLYVYGADAGYTVNSHTDVLTAKGGLTGTFSALDTSTSVALTATINYDANDAWLDVQQVNLSAIQGLTYTAASFSAAQRTQNAFTQINSQLLGSASGTPAASSAFIAGAASLQHAVSTAVMQQSLESLSGQLHAASATMAFEAIDADTRALSQRFDQLLDAPELAGHVGGWTQSFGDHGTLSRSGYGDVGFDLGGNLVGSDSRIGSRGVIGYAIGQSHGLGRLAASANQGSSRALEGMFYGGMLQGSWYAMGRVGMGSYREDMQRRLTLGGASTGVASYSHGQYQVAYGESGYRLELGGMRLTPYLDLQYARLRLDGFTEGGGYGFGLMAGTQRVQRWQAGAGLRATHQWMLPDGSRLSLHGSLLWQRAFAVQGDVLDASFTGLQQWAPVDGIGLSRYGGAAGLGLDWQATPRADLALDYRQQVDQHLHARQVALSYRWRF
ncbi:autotransporter domain-containing protein [Dyella sp. A6]|uniref:autotransporter domain-containing protein n=1 Tax=Dyella aluminiiresistens TaxID=3069105 RepID=UPI002E78AA91|nr:autotransporter domain-containing protein [Dyella sp. A6]